jgi:hypothetical protein
MTVYLAPISTAMELLSCSMDEENNYVLQASRDRISGAIALLIPPAIVGRSLCSAPPGRRGAKTRPVVF